MEQSKSQRTPRHESALDVEPGKARYVFDDGTVMNTNMHIQFDQNKGLGGCNIVSFTPHREIEFKDGRNPRLIKIAVGVNNKSNGRVTKLFANEFPDLQELYVDRGYKQIIVHSAPLEYLWMPDDMGGGQTVDVTVDMLKKSKCPPKVKLPLSSSNVVLDHNIEVENIDDVLRYGYDVLDLELRNDETGI